MRKCIICDRRLRTGIKYCYDCKSGGRLKKEEAKRKKENELYFRNIIFLFLGLLVFFVGVKYVFSGTMEGFIFLFLGGVMLFFFVKIVILGKKIRKKKEHQGGGLLEEKQEAWNRYSLTSLWFIAVACILVFIPALFPPEDLSFNPLSLLLLVPTLILIIIYLLRALENYKIA